ncbi:hypothetical protein DEU56DRAFT_913139 [Suillus clintonianus]|uniref:uncharacterized protein n=1 Tax=Suillus clintonianus TaxID=1904413 RepID=UPI001B8693BC|nr:uncharacterized protein DEU56DRAFT_913139 [Suillus clintonianus]KAG2136059.1 hypothetical protein DEU56DRAFT_913139 [Suillus clintonianus]
MGSAGKMRAEFAGWELRLYDRATATQLSSRLNQQTFHLPDGPQEEERDQEMRAAMEDALRVVRGEKSTLASAGNVNQWADKEKNTIQFGYDTDEEAEKWWRNQERAGGSRFLLGCTADSYRSM